MSKIVINLENEILKIEKVTARTSEDYIEYVKIDELIYNKEYTSKVKLTNQKENNRILFSKEFYKNGDREKIEGKDDNKNNANNENDDEFEEETNYDIDNIIVYTKNGKIKYCYGNMKNIYKNMVKLKFKVLKIKLNKKYLKIKVLAYLINPYDIKIEDTKFYIDSETYVRCNLKQYDEQISKTKMIFDKNIYDFNFKIQDIIKDESRINGTIRFGVIINENEVNYQIGIRNRKIKQRKYYKVPMKGIYVNDFAIHLRRTIKSNLVLVRRKKEPIEDTMKFKILESKFVSFIMYHLGKICEKLRRKKINLFYEKFAEKAEEGVFDLCQMCEKSNNTKNYFVIDKNKPDYDRIKDYDNVIVKYSLKFYWLVYNTQTFIASEVPGHLNVLRSNNKYFRRATYDKKFIFLQHGIIYMKNLGETSVFVKGRDGESEYIIVSSEKEKDIVAEMLKMDESNILKTGIAMYSNIKYNHINQNSDDYITIMLTWKPYEEHLYNFSESTYYKDIIKIYNMLKKYTNKEKIIIISHPKVFDLLKSTELGNQQWDKPISEALEKTKLLITDYSSVCYNSFYQGAGVIFYQPDLELYEEENGKLIPSDDEYIGKRVFDIDALEEIIKSSVKNEKINLKELRTKKYEDNYKLINEFSDGKNIERIYNELLRLGFI